ncbi:MAG: ATP-binding protein [Tannerellaceae bacterium]|jgi:AAA+ ATPase superfamily predicted ATPase|nr:ATP-binding protein [Tannerellaceae bacterium]
MKFYNREQELDVLAQTREVAFNSHSQMTALTGRRRIGKTKLILKSCEDTPTVYLFVRRSNEATLCAQFAETASRSLHTYIPSEITSFASLFETLMVAGRNLSFNLVIDEFQEFFYINPSIYGGIQDVWDRYKDTSHVNFIASGSVYTLMHRIFMEYKEPLYGRCDTILKLRPFATSVLKQILSDYHPHYTNDDLLALYTLTGGVPKYIELLLDKKCFTMPEMIDAVIQENSIFLEEGNILLIQEFGKKYGNYYAILSAIASGKNTASEISGSIGNASVGGLLQRLEEDYEVIARKRPILAKEGTQSVRYEISDNFLRFWFRYIVKYQDYVQSGLFAKLAEIVKADYPTYSGLTLERYFCEQLREKQLYKSIGPWWETSKGKGVDQNEIDIVAISAESPNVFIAEVKRQRKNFKPELFQQKVEVIRTKLFFKDKIETACLTLEDM